MACILAGLKRMPLPAKRLSPSCINAVPIAHGALLALQLETRRSEEVEAFASSASVAILLAMLDGHAFVLVAVVAMQAPCPVIRSQKARIVLRSREAAILDRGRK
jgi:hypothetical protein